MQPAIFLDRDGVIIENRTNYIRNWSEVHFYSQALESLVKLKSSPYKIVIITNQSAIGRGIISRNTACEINKHLVEEIVRAGGRIDGVFMCPHSPDDDCDCRKPRPGLILQAAKDLLIDLEHSIMIGDALADLQAGQAAGVQSLVLVRTGRGAEQESALDSSSLPPIHVCDTLIKAIEVLL